MSIRPSAVLLGLVAAVAVAGGTTWAIAQDDASPQWPVPTTKVLATGTAPSDNSYEVAHIDPESAGADPAKAFCYQIRVADSDGRQVGRTQGCDLTAKALDGQELRPSYTLLGSDRFFTILAPEGVTAMEVRIKGDTEAAKSRTIDTGTVGKLLMVTVGGPIISSRNAASFQDYDVRLLGPDGETVDEIPMGESQ